MPSPWMLYRVALARTDFSEERNASIIRVTRIDDLGTTFTVTNNRSTQRRNTSNVVLSSPILVTLMMEAIRSSETFYLQEPHGVISQMTAFFIVTSVKI
jgi:hypothetical protein